MQDNVFDLEAVQYLFFQTYALFLEEFLLCTIFVFKVKAACAPKYLLIGPLYDVDGLNTN